MHRIYFILIIWLCFRGITAAQTFMGMGFHEPPPLTEAPIYYFPFYKGLQLVEIDYRTIELAQANWRDAVRPRGGSDYADVLMVPPRNLFLLRDSLGRMVKVYNSTGRDTAAMFRILSDPQQARVTMHKARFKKGISSERWSWDRRERDTDDTMYVDYTYVLHGDSARQGRLDTLGRVVIPPVYDHIVYRYSNYWVMKNRHSGLIGPDFSIRIPAVYPHLEPYSAHVIIAGNRYFGLMNDSGRAITPMCYQQIERVGDALCYGDNDKVGLMNATGKELTKAMYRTIKPAPKGLLVSNDSGAYAFMNANGEVQTPFKYGSEATDLLPGYQMVSLADSRAYGLIDSLYHELSAFNYTRIRVLRNRTLVVNRNGGWVLMDLNGRELCKLYNTLHEAYGYVIAAEGRSYGVLDTSGRVRIAPVSQQNIGCLAEGRWMVSRDRKVAFYDTSGKALTPFQYEWAMCFSKGCAQVRRNGKWGLLDRNGAEMLPCQYDTLVILERVPPAAYAGEPTLFKVVQGDVCGVYNSNGKMIVPIVCRSVRIDELGRLVARKGKQRVYYKIED